MCNWIFQFLLVNRGEAEDFGVHNFEFFIIQSKQLSIHGCARGMAVFCHGRSDDLDLMIDNNHDKEKGCEQLVEPPAQPAHTTRMAVVSCRGFRVVC